ncbi:MAG TPA: hypothetical protein VIN01_07165 [Candidatus Dormibacteraeota bacterium]|jgi:hypothetical protein
MTYELWSGASGNIVGAWSSEDEALDAVRRAADRNGTGYVESLALMVEDDDGETQLIAQGAELVERLGVSA